MRCGGWFSAVAAGVAFWGLGLARGDEPAYRELVLADGPIAYYEFEETEGKGARDSSASGAHAGAYEGGVTLGQPSATARLGRAVGLDGASGRVRIPPHADFRSIGTGAFTIELWFSAARGTRGDLVNYKMEEGARDLGIFSGLEEDGQVSHYEALGQRAAAYGFRLREWHHVVVTRDAERKIVLFVDGAERAAGVGEMSWDFEAPLFVGANHPGAAFDSVSFPFEGSVDEVAIYAAALPAERVLLHYRTGDPEGAARAAARSSIPAGGGRLGAPAEDGLPEEGFEPLFNGLDLAGFRFHLGDGSAEPGETFRVADGAIVCSGSPPGYMYTEGSYRDFTLRFDWRYARPEGLADDASFPGNSGYLLAIQEHKVWPKSLEVQGMNRDAGLIIPIEIEVEFSVDRAAQRRAVRPVGEWNGMEIQSRGGVVTVEVNGIPTACVRRCEAREGPIGFQSEGAEIHWRNIRIRVEGR
ncbi:MAG: DUF1080 domain-containing protein [Planctomycetes bacterium]|nr:DUF1080 domain-containing protein [Planctomycetota bacterium]